jgi:hypothetical protein
VIAVLAVVAFYGAKSMGQSRDKPKQQIDMGSKKGITNTNVLPIKFFADKTIFFADSDGDGIPDLSDACPCNVGDKSDDPKSSGCPNLNDDDKVDVCDTVIAIAKGCNVEGSYKPASLEIKICRFLPAG